MGLALSQRASDFRIDLQVVPEGSEVGYFFLMSLFAAIPNRNPIRLKMDAAPRVKNLPLSFAAIV